MKAVAALRTSKTVVVAGSWGSGNIPKGEFPLSHKGVIRLGKAWQWCVQVVKDDTQQYRLLVAFEPAKRQYWAWLAAMDGNDQALIGRVEFHASHDGWHCHWKTGSLADVPRGAVRAGYSSERRRSCSGDARDISKADAFGLAYRLYNVASPHGGGLGV